MNWVRGPQREGEDHNSRGWGGGGTDSAKIRNWDWGEPVKEKEKINKNYF